MITYNRSAFGLNLIFRIHGSAVYRSVVPSSFAVAIFLVIRWVFHDSELGQELGHPYAIGVLVASTTFLIVFRANQGYSRYWEAATATHHMMSKWMDATVHTGVYHLQCDHYKHMKPPSYFDYPELNNLYLTRDRERGMEDVLEESASELNMDLSSHSLPGLDNKPKPKKDHAHSHMPHIHRPDKGVRRAKSEAAAERKQTVAVRSVQKSINYVHDKKKRDHAAQNRSERSHHDTMGLPEDIDSDFESEELPSTTSQVDTNAPPAPLFGRARLDGNWGKLFGDGKATFFDKNKPEELPAKGFASLEGGRTPALFLQELAHLSSLLMAVAFSTLRNDIEGAESPLDFYEPGSPWPEVDPDKDEWLRVTGCGAIRGHIATFLGYGHTPEERTRYNANRPLPVVGGVSDNEIRFLQMARGPYAKTMLCWNWLSEFCIREHLAGSTGAVGPPIISRIIQFLGDGMIFYNHARKIMFIPFPFVHAQLSVLFVIVMVPAIPFLMDQYTDDPILGCLLTFFTVMCLSGIHEVARELENPFRNIPNELPLVTFMAQYNEALITMYSGYHPDHFWDGKRMARKRGPPKKSASSPASLTSIKLTKVVEATSVEQENGTSNTNNSDRDEIQKLKRQLEEQQKLIEQLAAKISFDPVKESEELNILVETVQAGEMEDVDRSETKTTTTTSKETKME